MIAHVPKLDAFMDSGKNLSQWARHEDCVENLVINLPIPQQPQDSSHFEIGGDNPCSRHLFEIQMSGDCVDREFAAR